MNEIIFPHCKKAFKIDEAGFANIFSLNFLAENGKMPLCLKIYQVKMY